MSRPSEHFRKLSELFAAVIELTPTEREQAIVEGSAGDPHLEAEVRALVEADEREAAAEFLAGVVATEADAMRSRDLRGLRLGPWEVVEPLGEGGMGTVYLARRADGAYEAKAAVKLVGGGVLSPLLAERFMSERQILAGLSHPGVAQLLDGGSTEDGTPYLVMEYVDGLPITTWCDESKLDVRARILLFLRVCDAVAYAHRSLVAHRDLKPSNILVTTDGAPKLLDFGIAKLLDDMGDAGDGSAHADVALTPSYASPELIAGGRVGASADVYSLGVLLYELLTGRVPIETRGLPPATLRSAVTADVPPVASSVVTDREVHRSLSGDLDAVLSRALRKEPDARYASVEALAEDLRLHLAGHPIQTRRDDWWYRSAKLLRRNAGVVSAACLLLIAGLSFTINSVLTARALSRERDRAEAERASAERVSAFLTELFTEADPNATSSRDVTVRDILDRGATRVLTELDDEPESRATFALVIGQVYQALGEYEAAEPLLDSALALRLRQGDTNPEGLGDAYVENAAWAYNVGDYAGAIDFAQQAVDAYRRAPDVDMHTLADAIGWLADANAAAGDLARAETLIREAVTMHRDADPDANQPLATALVSLEDILRTAGQVDEAVLVGVEALDMTRRVYGVEHLEVANALNQLASSLNAAGRTDEAVPLVEQSLDIRRAAFSGPHAETASSLGNLANMLSNLGRNQDAVSPRRESVQMLRAIFPDEHPYVAGSLAALGNVLLRADSLDAAESVLAESLTLSRVAFGPDHPQVASPLIGLGVLYRRTGRYAQSLELLREAHDIRTKTLPPGHFNVAAAALEVGLTLDEMGRAEEATAWLREAYTIFLDAFGEADDRTERARLALEASLR